MKNIILTIICTGTTKTKKYNYNDLCKKLYILRYLITDDLRANDNVFWNSENIDNRIQLKNDILKIDRFNIQDKYYYHIINEFENGNHYGISK